MRKVKLTLIYNFFFIHEIPTFLFNKFFLINKKQKLESVFIHAKRSKV